MYGFGSAFRCKPFRDVDILAVVKDGPTSALDIYYDLQSALKAATMQYGAPIDLTVLTTVEFDSRPLMCMNELIPLWSSETQFQR